MEKNKNLWIWIVVILAAVIGLVFWMTNSSAPVSVSQNNAPVAPVVPTEDISAGSVNAGAGVTIAYADALVKYKNARIQLDDNCQADSQNQKMSVKNNTDIMIDNRSAMARTIHLGSVFTVKAYGFKIVKISSAKLPATWLLDCDGSQNVATVSIEK
jgi:hypothetical protein